MTKSPDNRLIRGAKINVLGLFARLGHPLAVFLFTRWFGAETFSHYLLAFVGFEIAITASSAGYADAIVVYGSHALGIEEPDSSKKRKTAIATAFRQSLSVSLGVAIIAQFGSPFLIAEVFSEHQVLWPTVSLVIWSLPLSTWVRGVVAITKTRARMEWDAAFAAFEPLLLISFGSIAYIVDAGLNGLFVAHFATYLMLAMLSLIPLHREVGVFVFLHELKTFPANPLIWKFAGPQSLNLSLSRYLERIDLLMLAAFGFSAVQVAWYGTAAIFVGNLRQIRVVFSTALAPLASEYFARRQFNELLSNLFRVTRLSISIAAPVILVVAFLGEEIFLLFDESYRGDSRFILALLIAPFSSCALGLAGNYLIYSGHSRANFLNSLAIATLNTGFNFWMIPRYGLLGAAIATGLATLIIMIAQVVELRYLTSLRFPLKAILPETLALLGCAGLNIWFYNLSQIVIPGGLVTGIFLNLAVYGVIVMTLKGIFLRDVRGS